MTEEPLIDPERVVEILRDCLFTDEEMDGIPDDTLPDQAVVVEGVINPYALHSERLESHRKEVHDMLQCLPKNFRPTAQGGGGGWSFINACEDKNGCLWTGVHQTVDALLVLGIGLGLAEWLLPRSVWPSLPGGVPYVAVLV